VTRVNVAALRVRDPQHPALVRMDDAARLLVGDADATADDMAVWLDGLVKDLGVPRLSMWGVGLAELPALVDQAGRSSSMKGNPIALTAEELSAAVIAAL
jgi:alcohol dehydrogenase class IV